MNQVIQLDRQLFQLVNQQWSNDLFDRLMPFIRNQNTWLPLYIFLLVFALINFNNQKWWWIVYAVALTGLSDFISSSIIKPNIFRLRPCNDPSLVDTIHVLVTYRPQSSSFTSSHAMNHFAMAAFFYFTLEKFMGKWALFFFVWAFSVCYAQVYIGVHFPLDVFCGGLIGFVFGYLSARLFNKNHQLL